MEMEMRKRVKVLLNCSGADRKSADSSAWAYGRTPLTRNIFYNR